MPRMQLISRTELWRRMASEDPPVVIEALGRDFYADAHLPGAVNVQPSDMDALTAALPHELDTAVVVYGTSSGSQARAVADAAEALGYRYVWLYAGGKEEWVEAGLPVERCAGAGGPA